MAARHRRLMDIHRYITIIITITAITLIMRLYDAGFHSKCRPKPVDDFEKYPQTDRVARSNFGAVHSDLGEIKREHFARVLV